VFHKAWARMKYCQSCESEDACLLKLKWHLMNSSYHHTKEEDIVGVLDTALVMQDFIPRKELEHLLEKEEEARQSADLASRTKRLKGPQPPRQPPPHNRDSPSSSSRAAGDGDSYPLAVIGRRDKPAMVIGKKLSMIPLDTSELFSMQTQ
jgi:hypothetical protein